MLTDQEIALAVGGMNAVGWTTNDTGFNLANLQKEDAKPGAMAVKTNQTIIERAKRAGQAVLQFRECKAKETDLQKQLAESRTNQMLLDPLRLGGNSVVRWTEKTLNTPKDILQQINKGEIMPGTSTAKQIGKKIAEQIVRRELSEMPTFSESLKQTTGIELPAIPEIKVPRPFEYQSEKYKREAQIGEELGATAIDLLLLKRGITNSRINSLLNLRIFETSPKTSAIISETGVLRSPVSINAIEVPRTPNLPKVTTMEELLKINGVPGSEGVILNQKTVRNADIWKLSNENGIEYALTREKGKFVLRSGALDKVRTPLNKRPILHTHPPDELGEFSKLPSKPDINTLNRIWRMNQNGRRPASMIVWGSEPHQVTIFRATGPFDKLK